MSTSKQARIRFIPHCHQRYNTVGDYLVDEHGILEFRISDSGNPDYNFLVLIHEIVEEYLTRRLGIEEPDIAAFDQAHEDHEDPGSIQEAPYHRQHVFAEIIERMLCQEMGVDWEEYDDQLVQLIHERRGEGTL